MESITRTHRLSSAANAKLLGKKAFKGNEGCAPQAGYLLMRRSFTMPLALAKSIWPV
jgi:hypothetical protein